MGGGLAVDGGAQRQDDLARPTRPNRRVRPALPGFRVRAGLHAFDEGGDVQLLRPAPVERRERAAEDVIQALEGAAALERPEVADILDHANQRPVACRVAAEGAGIGRIQVAAGRTRPDVLGRLLQGRGEGQHEGLRLLDHLERRPARRARPEARQAGEQLDQAIEIADGHDRRAGPAHTPKAPPLTWAR